MIKNTFFCILLFIGTLLESLNATKKTMGMTQIEIGHEKYFYSENLETSVLEDVGHPDEGFDKKYQKGGGASKQGVNLVEDCVYKDEPNDNPDAFGQNNYKSGYYGCFNRKCGTQLEGEDFYSTAKSRTIKLLIVSCSIFVLSLITYTAFAKEKKIRINSLKRQKEQYHIAANNSSLIDRTPIQSMVRSRKKRGPDGLNDNNTENKNSQNHYSSKNNEEYNQHDSSASEAFPTNLNENENPMFLSTKDQEVSLFDKTYGDYQSTIYT